jgi:large subunit ribosomal protein L15
MPIKVHDLKPPAGSKRPARRVGRGIAGKGGKTPFRVEYAVVNLEKLAGFDAGTTVDPDTLRDRGLVAKRGLVKILGRGEISVSLTVKAHAFSDAARRAIEAAGGSVEVLAAPWGDRRPAARGNALTNR